MRTRVNLTLSVLALLCLGLSWSVHDSFALGTIVLVTVNWWLKFAWRETR